MRSGISVSLSPSDRERLDRIRKDRNAARKHAWRAEIVLLSADGAGTNEIMRRTGTSKTCVWRWQERFMQEGVEGLLRDKTRPSRIPPLAPAIAEQVVARTLEDPSGETTHWTALMMATEIGISVSSVQRIWRAHGLQPHRVRQFKLSNDPKFVEKLRDLPPAEWPRSQSLLTEVSSRSATSLGAAGVGGAIQTAQPTPADAMASRFRRSWTRCASSGPGQTANQLFSYEVFSQAACDR